MATIISEQIAIESDILCMTEHCINVHHQDIHQQIQSTIRKTIQQKVNLQITSSNLQTESPYLPGGTAIAVTGNSVGRLEQTIRGEDDMGRWTYATMKRKHQSPITVISVYQVNIRPTNDVGITAWHQQRINLNKLGKSHLHPRQAFIQDLTKKVKEFQSMNHDIILGGDFNETAAKPRSGLLKLMVDTGLLDPWTHRFPTHPTFNTYRRGSQRIDTILCSPSVLPMIRSISYAPFNWFTNSDHRAMIIDFSSINIFQEPDDTTQLSVHQRAIRSNDKKRTQEYVNLCYQHLTQNNAQKFLNRMDQQTATSKEVETYDKILTQACLSAEKHCRRRRPEFYSNKINSLRIRTSIARGYFNQLRKFNNSNTDGFQARLDRASTSIEFKDTPTAAYQVYKSLRTELQDASKQSRDVREAELNSRINEKHEIGSPEHLKRLKNIKIGEASKRAWQSIKFLRTQSGSTQTLNRIDIPASWPIPISNSTQWNTLENPATCTQWQTITSPTDIEHYIRLRNHGHFGQAQGTPFTELPLRSEINWQADTPTSDDILNGYHQLDTINAIPQCQALLDTCKAASELDLLPAYITEKEFERKIQIWRETTTTSPSGRHLGHYKALFIKPIPNTEPEEPGQPTFADKQTFIRRSILAIINFCIRTGHSLERWKTIVNTMIFKETGNYKINRLRVIHIYEADFNLLLAIKWRQLIQHAEMSGTINEGLFGGRPGREAQSLTFLEELKYDLSILTRRTLFHFDNDAASCYDRIIISLASLLNRKYGMNRRITTVHATTLEEPRFHLRTPTGISSQSYTHTLQFPIYGSGQGSGNSPAIWLFISSTICDIHQTISYGASFTNPEGNETVRLSMVGFVDDCTCTYNDFQPQTELDYKTMTRRMQHDAQTWNDLLWCTGGKLELNKCSFHALRFEFLPNGSPRVIADPPEEPILVKDSETNEMIPILAKSSSDPHKTLGHWKAPSEPKSKTQLAALVEKSQQQAILIATGTLSRHGASLAYFGIYLASLKYVLPQCHFQHEQLDKAEAKTISTILAKCGFNRHTPRPIRYAPATYAGCGFLPWWVIQSEGQISLFLKHWRTDTIISQTLRVATAWGQWMSGLSHSFLFDVSTPLPHLDAPWLTSLRSALDRANMKIHLQHSYVMPPERSNDVHIMEWAALHSDLPPEALKVLNSCRLYLHVTTVSELFDTDGLRILSYMYECRRPPWFNKRQYMPLQIRPSSYQIRKIWKPFLDRWIQKIAYHQTHSLGPWTQQAAHFRPYRTSYVDRHCSPDLYEPTFYMWYLDTYWKMIPITTTSPNWILLSLQHATIWRPTSTSTPIHLIPAGYLNTRQTFRCATTPQVYSPPRSLPLLPAMPINAILDAPILTDPYSADTTTFTHTSPEFQSHTSNLSAWESLLLQHVRFGSDIPQITQLLHSLYRSPGHRLFAIVQHWYIDNTASFGWILFSTTGDYIAAAFGPSPGPPSRSRADAWGILSLLRFFYHFPRFQNQSILYPPVTILHRNPRIIRIMSSRPNWSTVYCNETLTPDWDILEQSFVSLQDLEIPLTWQTLMDFKRLYHRLDYTPLFLFESRIDTLKTRTKEFLENFYQRIDFSPFLPASSCMLIASHGTIHQHYHTAYREAVTVPALHQYLCSKYSWTPSTLSDVTWQWFTRAACLYRHASKNHLTKLIYNQLPTPDRLQKQGGKHWEPAICPHCQSESRETFDHILQCDHPSAIQFRLDFPKVVTSHCHKFRAPPAVQQAILQALDYALGRPYSPAPLPQSKVSALYGAQANIGWTNFLRGFLSIKWRRYLIDQITARPKPTLRCTPDQFFYKLIILFWTAQTDLWKSYQESRHSPPSFDSPSHKHMELQRDVQYLFSLRQAVCPEHQSVYFPSNFDTFISDSTTTQLRVYLFNYSDAIHQSIKEAKTRASSRTQPIWTFGGFTRILRPSPPAIAPPTLDHIPPPLPPLRRIQQSLTTWFRRRILPSNPLGPTANSPLSTAPQNDPSSPSLHRNPLPSASIPNPPVPPHHKHSRWKRPS
jgi:hypothetical protein